MHKKYIVFWSALIISLATCLIYSKDLFFKKENLLSGEKIQQIIDYPIPQVLKRYQKDFKVTPSTAKEHEKELKRYFILGELFPDEHFEMYSDEVDNLWHTFLLFTKEYQTFCIKNFGHFIHHNPIEEKEQ